jgi:hypothetical protein
MVVSTTDVSYSSSQLISVVWRAQGWLPSYCGRASNPGVGMDPLASSVEFNFTGINFQILHALESWSYSRAVPRFPVFQRRSLSTSITVDGADRCKVLFGAIIYEVPGVVCHTPEKARTVRCEWLAPNQINMPVLTERVHI